MIWQYVQSIMGGIAKSCSLNRKKPRVHKAVVSTVGHSLKTVLQSVRCDGCLQCSVWIMTVTSAFVWFG